MRLIFIGPPGVGKGTQSALFASRMGIFTLSSGEIFRKEIDAQTDRGRLAQSYIRHGDLVPNGVTIEMMAKRLREPEVRKKGFILDGFPRTIRQAEALEEILTELDMPLESVVSLEVDVQLIVDRLKDRLGCTKCGENYNSKSKPPTRDGFCDKCNSPLMVRSDDQPEAIRNRLESFRDETAPVVDFYENLGLLRRVDSSRDPEQVYQDILTSIK